MIKLADNNIPMPTMEAMHELTARANRGDPDALQDLRKLLDSHPDVWQHLGDLGRCAEVALIDVMVDGNELLRESINRSVAKMKKELLSDNPAELERICVQRVVANYLETQWYSIKSPDPKGELAWAKFALRRKESAERRLQQSIRSLIWVQKLNPPPAEKPKRKKKRRKLNGASGNGSTANGLRARSAVAAGGPVNRLGQLVGSN